MPLRAAVGKGGWDPLIYGLLLISLEEMELEKARLSLFCTAFLPEQVEFCKSI